MVTELFYSHLIWTEVFEKFRGVPFSVFRYSLTKTDGFGAPKSFSAFEKRAPRQTLRRNPPEVRVTSAQKPCTKIIYIVLQTSVGLFQISSQNNSFLATPNVENECWTSYETLESFGISELWNLFSLVPVGNCFRCYFRQLFMHLAFRKCKNDCKILKITLVQIFVH